MCIKSVPIINSIDPIKKNPNYSTPLPMNPSYKKLIDSSYSRFIKWEKQNEYPFLSSQPDKFSLLFKMNDQENKFYNKPGKQFPIFINTNKNKNRLQTSLSTFSKQGTGLLPSQALGLGSNQTIHFNRSNQVGKQNKNLFSIYYQGKDLKQRFINLLMVDGKKIKADQLFVTALNKFTLIIEKVMELEKSKLVTSSLPLSNEKISTNLLYTIKPKKESFPFKIVHFKEGNSGKKRNDQRSGVGELGQKSSLFSSKNKENGLEKNPKLVGTKKFAGFLSRQGSQTFLLENTEIDFKKEYNNFWVTTIDSEKLSLLLNNLQDKLFACLSNSYFSFPYTTDTQTSTQKNNFKKEQRDVLWRPEKSNIEKKAERGVLTSTEAGTFFSVNQNNGLFHQKPVLSIYLQKAVENVIPNLEVRKVRIGRKTYQVPALISRKKGEGLAIRWIIDAARQNNKNSTRGFSDCLAQELVLAYNKKGQARQKRDELHKTAQANRAYIRYRWW